MRFPRATRPIETALTLRLVFRLPLRRAEGFLRSVLSLMSVDLEAPDHTTLSRRSQHLNVRLHVIRPDEALHLIIDSTGLSIVGEGEWAAVKHRGRGRRGWKTLHLGVDRSGVIVAHTLTDGHADDAPTGLRLIDAVDGDISRVTADGAYDTIAIYDAAEVRGDDRGSRFAMETPIEPSRRHHPETATDRTASVEEGVQLPSTGARGERRLPVQVDHR